MSRQPSAAKPKKIIDLVNEKMQAIAKDPDAAETNARLAVRAIMEGRFSPEWREYMLQFVEKDPANADAPLNPAHLARLLAVDDTIADEDMNRRRAYLLGNAVCGGGSPGATGTGRLDNGVDTIDNGL